MKLLTYSYQDKEYVGVVAKDEISIHTFNKNGFSYQSMNELIDNFSVKEVSLLCEKEVGDILIQDVQIIAPIPIPKQDIICLGENYVEHAKESAKFKNENYKSKSSPIYFSKRVNRAVGAGELIHGHSHMVDSLDYEVELAVIIGKEAKNVIKENVYKYILGYTILNDVSARNLQKKHQQWYIGKSLDGFTVMGPWIVTADEFENPLNLDILSRINDELRQNSNTNCMITTIEDAICELSEGITLKPGTIIAMGTPAGVGMGFTPPKYLKQGDLIECEIQGIGCLKNTVE